MHNKLKTLVSTLNFFSKRLPTLFFSATFLLLFSCAHKQAETRQKELVFITGSHFDEASWDPVIKNLNSAKFVTLSITREGRDPNKPAHLKQIAEAACLKMHDTSILVAHSFGGATANEIVGTCPNKVVKIIYVSALVPLNQEHPTDILKGADQKQYLSAVKIEKDRITPKSKVEFSQILDSELHLDERQLPPVYSESMLNLADTVTFDQKIYTAIPKYYIYTNLDKIISLESQKKLASRIVFIGSNSLASGHLPMLSKPKELAQIIDAFTQD